MMRKSVFIIGIFLIGLFFSFSGCTDKLGIVDLSGEVKLEPDQKDWAYRSIDANDLRRSGLNPAKRLKDYRGALEIQKTVKIGDHDYIFVTRFTKGLPIMDIFIADEYWGKGFQTLVYSLSRHQLMELFTSKQSETGDSWDTRLDPDDACDDHLAKKVLEREGVCCSLFQDPTTGFDCMIESEYSIKSVSERTMADGKPVRNDHYQLQYDSVSIQGNSEIRIGFRQCLSGIKTVAGKTISFYVVDWNMDGWFTEADKVWCDYTGKMYNFGEEARLTRSLISAKDNSYIVRLVQLGDNEQYLLKIQLVKPGKRKV
jgi:hypothetical protein